jgi:hypothetical protein
MVQLVTTVLWWVTEIFLINSLESHWRKWLFALSNMSDLKLFLDRLLGLQEVEAPRMSRPKHRPPLPTRDISGTPAVRGWVDSRTLMRLEGLSYWKRSALFWEPNSRLPDQLHHRISAHERPKPEFHWQLYWDCLCKQWKLLVSTLSSPQKNYAVFPQSRVVLWRKA